MSDMFDEIKNDLAAIRKLAEVILEAVDETEEKLDSLIYEPVDSQNMRIGDECRQKGTLEWHPVINDGCVRLINYEFRRRKNV